MDAADDAREYKDAQDYVTEREKVRAENKARKARGDKPLKMPTKPKRDGASSRRRMGSYESDEDDPIDDVLLPSDTRELRYEGREFQSGRC